PALILGEQRWDYLYIDDAVEAICRLALETEAQGVFNLGSGEAHTVRSWVETTRDLIDPSLPLGFGELPYRPDQMMLLQADISKLQAATGWQPQIGPREGLQRTIDWHRARRGLTIEEAR
ncbi:MAG: GDP-mannose 4,6-dehydratase, partial [Armatimonadota bacterium]|nr:GDP-mannose 4,6-dehydratase [Armatimonadota bacterium]